MLRPIVGITSLSEEKLKAIAMQDVFPVENIERHDVSYRKHDVIFIGSEMKHGGWIYDYYQGPDERYWFKKRKLLESGKIVSEHEAIFGYEEGRRRMKRRRQKKSSDPRKITTQKK